MLASGPLNRGERQMDPPRSAQPTAIRRSPYSYI